jgi:hypothetical protein
LLRRQFGPLLLATAFYIALRLIIPTVSVFGGVADMVIVTTLFMAAQILVIRYVCALEFSFAAGGIGFLLSLAVFSGLFYGRHALGWGSWADLPLDISRIAAACFLGYIVSFALRDKNIILPIAAFAAYLDIWTVTIGPTSHFLATVPEVVQRVSAQMPLPRSYHGAAPSFIGPADFVFLAVFFGAIYRLKMEAARTFWFTTFLLSAAMLVVMLVEQVPGIPALVPMGIAVVAANFRHFKLSKQEKWSVLIVSTILVLSLSIHLLHRYAQ